MALVVKNSPANAGDVRDLGSIPGSGRAPGGGQYSVEVQNWGQAANYSLGAEFNHSLFL